MPKSLQDQLKQLLNDPAKVRKLKFSDGRTVAEVLESEAARLRSLILEEMEKAMLDEPGWYKRTGAFMKSLDDNLVLDPLTNTIEITFTDDLAYHNSYFTKFYPSYDKKGFVPLLMEDGFKRLFSENPYPATHYIEKAIERFNKTKLKGITVRVQKTYEDTTYFDKEL